MSGLAREPIRFGERPSPLAPSAVFARNDVARRLAARLLRAPDERLARLRGAGGRTWLLVHGQAEDLPWVDGVCYLAEDPRAPGIWLPTTLTTRAHPELVRRALASVVGTSMLAVVPDQSLVVPMDDLAALDPGWLELLAKEKAWGAK